MSVIPCQVPGENWLTGRKLCPRERPHGVIPHQASPRASPLLLPLTLKSHMLPARGSCKSPDHRVWFGKFASDPLVHLIPRFLKWPLKWNSQLAKATLIEVCRTGVGRCWDAIWLASHSSVWIVPRFDAPLAGILAGHSLLPYSNPIATLSHIMKSSTDRTTADLKPDLIGLNCISGHLWPPVLGSRQVAAATTGQDQNVVRDHCGFESLAVVWSRQLEMRIFVWRVAVQMGEIPRDST